METAARIGSSILIKGTLIADEPLTIAGRVDGTVEIKGHALTLAAGGRLTADVTAETIIIDGQVNGSLTADVRIIVRATATIDGDLLAPSISVAEGATLNGKIETVAHRASLFPVPMLDAAPSAA
jgi:cytoskeletal protein CcmA (bactofilin family)